MYTHTTALITHAIRYDFRPTTQLGIEWYVQNHVLGHVSNIRKWCNDEFATVDGKFNVIAS